MTRGEMVVALAFAGVLAALWGFASVPVASHSTAFAAGVLSLYLVARGLYG